MKNKKTTKDQWKSVLFDAESTILLLKDVDVLNRKSRKEWTLLRPVCTLQNMACFEDVIVLKATVSQLFQTNFISLNWTHQMLQHTTGKTIDCCSNNVCYDTAFVSGTDSFQYHLNVLQCRIFCVILIDIYNQWQ